MTSVEYDNLGLLLSSSISGRRTTCEYNEQTRQIGGRGNALSNSSGVRYRGQLYDAATDQVYLRNRFYSPSLGRFMSMDPKGMVDGPNMYNYAGGDPVNRWDPMGTEIQYLTNPGVAVHMIPSMDEGQTELTRRLMNDGKVHFFQSPEHLARVLGNEKNREHYARKVGTTMTGILGDILQGKLNSLARRVQREQAREFNRTFPRRLTMDDQFDHEWAAMGMTSPAVGRLNRQLIADEYNILTGIKGIIGLTKSILSLPALLKAGAGGADDLVRFGGSITAGAATLSVEMPAAVAMNPALLKKWLILVAGQIDGIAATDAMQGAVYVGFRSLNMSGGEGFHRVISNKSRLIRPAPDAEHHIFTKKWRRLFKKKYDIDVDDFVVDVDDLTHQALHAGKKALNNNAGWWDEMLMSRIREAERLRGTLSKQEVLEIGDELLKRFRLDHLPKHRYSNAP